MNRFDRGTCRKLNDEIAAALREVAARHGLTVQVGGGKFDSLSFTPKIVLRVRETEDGRSAEEVEFARVAILFGLTPDAYGKEFSCIGETFRVVGLRPRAGRRPLIGRRVSDGKEFVFPVEVVKN